MIRFMMSLLSSNENRSTVATFFETSSQRDGNVSQESLCLLFTCDADEKGLRLSDALSVPPKLIQSHSDRLEIVWRHVSAQKKKLCKFRATAWSTKKRVMRSVKKARFPVERPSFRFIAQQFYPWTARLLQSAPSRDRRTSERRKEEPQKVSCVSGVPRMLHFFHTIEPLVD